MLHLLPIKTLLTAFTICLGLIVLGAFHVGSMGNGDLIADIRWISRTLPYPALAIALLPCLAWRWSKSIQKMVFPYLGGHWEGEFHFDGKNGKETRSAKLKVRHSLLSIKMIMSSKESTSRTIFVHAERDRDIDRDRLYYSYRNERNEGVENAGEQYIGLAIIRADMDENATLTGDYFTGKTRIGRLSFERVERWKWWQFWQ